MRFYKMTIALSGAPLKYKRRKIRAALRLGR